MVFERFKFEKGYRFVFFFSSWSEIRYAFPSGLALLVYKELFFFRNKIGKFVALLKCLRKWTPLLVNSGHML